MKTFEKFRALISQPEADSDTIHDAAFGNGFTDLRCYIVKILPLGGKGEFEKWHCQYANKLSIFVNSASGIIQQSGIISPKGFQWTSQRTFSLPCR